jgi:hypothetical protein
MSNSSNRAWKFYFPSAENSEIGPGGSTEKCAGLKTTLKGGIEMIELHASVRQSMLLLLSIDPGERVMYPDYGCSLNKLVFAPNDETTSGLAIHYIRQAVKKWEPRVHILAIDTHADTDVPELLVIELKYRVIATQKEDTVLFKFDLSGRGV